ncbi:MAG: type II secretion system F family protein, partial [Planctomycetaceae bacterium]|nr:type II secretion system F family protein [Planctomycetaceae bacterium]
FWLSFLLIFLTMLLAGLTVVRARTRVRNISDLPDGVRIPRPGWFRRSLAGAIPLLPGELTALEQDLKRAGYYGPYALVEYLGARNFVVVMLLMVGGFGAVIADPDSPLPKTILISTAVVAIAAYVIPRSVLHAQATKRLDQIQRGLPDALDIIRMCLTAGLPLRDSLNQVAKEIDFFHPAIAVEFEVIRRHAEADTMQKALQEFSRRMNTTDISALSALVSQTERAGTHVASAVVEFADSVRRQFRQRAEEKAAKTSVKMLFPVVLCLAPPVFILLVGPPVLQLKNFVRDAHKPGGVLEQNSDSLENTTVQR